MMNVTSGIEFASVGPLWTNSTNVTFTELSRPTSVDLEPIDSYSTVSTFVDTVPTKEIEIPEVEFELKWLDALSLYIKGLFVIFAVLMVMYLLGRKVVAHVRMRFGRDLSVNFRLGDWSRDGTDAASNGVQHGSGGGGDSVGRKGRNVALRNFV